MSEQEEKDYIEEIDPEEFKAYKDFYDLTNKHCDLVIYSLWHAEEISKKILGTHFPMGAYLHWEAKHFEVEDCPEGKLAAYEILLNEFKTGCSFSNGMKGEITLNILNCFIKAASGDIVSDEAKFVHYLLKKDACDDVFIPKQTKEFTIDLEESLKKFDKILFYFLQCKQDYRHREIADSFSRILELLDKVIEKKGDHFLEDTTIIELVKLFCGGSFNAPGEYAEKFINFKKAFRYANLRQEAFDVQNTLRQHLSYKGLHSEAAKVLESMVEKFGYKTSLTISELLLKGRCELEKDQEKAIFYLEEFLDGWRYDEEKRGNHDFPLALDYTLDRGFCTRVKDYFEHIPSDSKNALSFFKCALKILEISEDFECYEEVHDWYGRFVNENFEKLIDFGKKAKKANSTYFLKQLLSFCFVHLTRSPEMEREVIFLCLLPLSDDEIFEDWVTWGSEICEIDDQEAFDQLVKVIYVNLEKRFQANPGLTDYLFSMISESPEKIESKEDLLLPRDSKWYLLPMKGNQEVFDDFEIDTSFESNVKADTYKIETKQQEKKSWPVVPLKENWNFPDVRTSERNTLFLSKDFLIVFMVRPLTLGSSSIEPHETYIQHLYAITAYSRVNESTRVDPDSPICCYSIEKATLPMAVPMLCGYFSSGRHANFGSYKEEINDDVAALQVLTDKVLKMLEITEELTIGEEPVFPEVAGGSVQRKKRKTDSICKLLRAKLMQIS